MDKKYLTKAVKDASNGNRYPIQSCGNFVKKTNDINIRKENSSRAKGLYGFKNRALNMSQKEIKDAWKQASIDTKNSKIQTRGE